MNAIKTSGFGGLFADFGAVKPRGGPTGAGWSDDVCLYRAYGI